jgi:hypothetical protein
MALSGFLHAHEGLGIGAAAVGGFDEGFVEGERCGIWVYWSTWGGDGCGG